MSGGGGDVSGIENSMGWVGLESAATPWMYHYPLEHEAGAPMETREIETLPLFPIKQEEEQEGEEAEKKGEFISHCHLNNCTNTTTDNNNDGSNQCLPAFYWDGVGPVDHHHHPYNDHHQQNDGSSGAAVHQAASLDLTLNSYYYAPPEST